MKTETKHTAGKMELISGASGNGDATSARLALAWNSLDELREALSDLLIWSSIPDNGSKDAVLLRDKARAALQKAGVE